MSDNVFSFPGQAYEPDFPSGVRSSTPRIKRLEEALTKIRDGLADIGDTPGQRMTLITKADAHAIACAALDSKSG